MNKTKFLDSPPDEMAHAERMLRNAQADYDNAARRLAQAADRLAQLRYAAGRSKIKPAGDGK